MRPVLTLAVLLMAGCERELTPEEQAALDERDVALVEQANKAMPPLRQVTPEPILYPDIERYDLYGAACNYAPGTSLGTRVVARESDAFVKIEGEIIRLAADAGSRELPMRTRSLYTGRDHALRLGIDGEGEQAGEETVNFEGSVTLLDAHGRVIYEGSGLAQCGS
jgi:hypothetical protein